jgi:hypothetical protein
MDHFKFDMAFLPKVFGASICFEKMLLSSTFKYRLTLQLLWINVSVSIYNKHLPKF